MSLIDSLRRLVFGRLVGDVRPMRETPRVETADGRTQALRALKAYVEELTFYRSGGDGKAPIPFTLKPQRVGNNDVKPRFFIEEADAAEDLVLPCAVVAAPQPAEHLAGSLGKWPIESSRDKFGKGTVLWNLGTEYKEILTIDIVAASRAERRAMIRGFRRALSPLEARPSLKLVVPGYFDQVATFTLMNTQIVDTDVFLGRRRAILSVDLRFTEVELENYVALRPRIEVETKPSSE